MEKIKIEDLKTNGGYEVLTKVISVSEKIAYGKLIAENVCEVKDNGLGVIDEVMKGIYIKLYEVILYTNIELSSITLESYDLLNQCGVFKAIQENNKDCCDFEEIVNASCLNKEKEFTLESVGAQRIQDTFEVLNTIGEHVNKVLDRVDPNLLTKYLSKPVAMFAKKMPDFSKVEKFDMNSIKKELNKNG